MFRFLVAATVLVGSTAMAADDARKKYVEALVKRNAETRAAAGRAAEAVNAKEAARMAAARDEATTERQKLEKAVAAQEKVMGDAAALLAANRFGPVTGEFFFKKDPVTGAYTIRHDTEEGKAAGVKLAQEGLDYAAKKLDAVKAKLYTAPPSPSDSPVATARSSPLITSLPADGNSISTGQIGQFAMAGKVSKVIDDKTLLVKTAKYTLWVEAPSKGMADGRPFAIDGVYEVVGTKKYNSRTLFHLRPFSPLTEKELKAIRGK